MDILTARLHNHLLTGESRNPEQVVEHMLCMQAQDRTQHLRAIASRAGCSRAQVEQAYNDGLIVRTRTQRGTIHTVAAADAGWMVRLCASKTLGGFTKRKEFLGIDNNQYDRALQLIQEYLSSGPKLRKQIGSHLSSSGIDVTSGILYNILCFAGSSGITVQGPLIDGEQAFVLVSQWIQSPKQLDGEEALRELCLRYFSSHGPATIEDLQRRSGLGKTQLRLGIQGCGDMLTSTEYEGKTYYQSSTSTLPQGANSCHFLAGFDERLLGYRDRTATLHLDHHTLVDVSRNGIFKPTLMIEGQTLGSRSVKHKSKITEITIKPFISLTEQQQELLYSSTKDYESYIKKPISLTFNL